MGNRVRYRFSIGRGAFHASYKQGVDVDGIAGTKAGLGYLKFLLTRCRKSSGHDPDRPPLNRYTKSYEDPMRNPELAGCRGWS